MKIKALGIILFLFATRIVAQDFKPLTYTPPEEVYKKDTSQRKVFYGVSWQQYWGKFLDTNYPKPVFWKPCIGINARVEYYPIRTIGVGIGLGIQQRGTGLINQDKTRGTSFSLTNNSNDTDSTYLERLRFTTFEMPVTLLFSPFQIVRNLRLSGSLGVVFLHTLSVQDIWLSPADGDQKKAGLADQFNRTGLGLFASIGPEISLAETRFQLHFVYSRGLTNVYRENYRAKLGTAGIRLSWIF